MVIHKTVVLYDPNEKVAPATILEKRANARGELKRRGR